MKNVKSKSKREPRGKSEHDEERRRKEGEKKNTNREAERKKWAKEREREKKNEDNLEIGQYREGRKKKNNVIMGE